jgi:hypothetical protein
VYPYWPSASTGCAFGEGAQRPERARSFFLGCVCHWGRTLRSQGHERYRDLSNNIYYFPVESRVSLLQHIRQFIEPGGFLLLITCCQGGSLGVEILNLWGAATLTGGRLPSKHELIRQLHHAGFQDVQTIRLIPGEEFFAFKALPGENA